jgi:hypothetical protein
MDTETVLKVIAMLDNNLASTRDEDVKLYYSFSPEENRMLGRRKALEDFRDTLQGFIEAQVNQVENDMNRGD